MKLQSPFAISARLLPALQVGGAWISLKHDGYTGDDRDIYRWYIDLNGEEYSASDLHSGVGGNASLQSMFESLLAFLGACGESIRYGERTGIPGENADLFPAPVAQWASEHADELSMLECELQETPNLISEE